MKLRAGDWVEIRTKQEILDTLDKNGRLEGLPFMPQMFSYCGQRFRVYKRAHKTCDTVTKTGGRRLTDSVHLELRCDGEAYGGCQAACLLFWKEAWLKPVGKGCKSPASTIGAEHRTVDNNGGCTEADVLAATMAPDQSAGEEPTYVCQATLLPTYTTILPWWDIRQYLEDYTSGNITIGRIISALSYACYHRLLRHRVRLAPPLLKLYDSFQALWGGSPYPRRTGTIQAGNPTPSVNLNLQPGELVMVKSYGEILETLDEYNKNKGLLFDAELVPYCGGTYRVKVRLSKFLDERTGKMTTIKTPAIILENVWCQSRYSDCRLFCPRSIYSWWREAWLERIPEGEK